MLHWIQSAKEHWKITLPDTNDEYVYFNPINGLKILIDRNGKPSIKGQFLEFYNARLVHTFVNNDQTPHFIIDTDSDFPHLDNFYHPALKSKKINFYLRELPYLSTRKFEFKDSSQIELSKTSATREELKTTLVGFNSNQVPTVCFELEAIQRFVKKHNLDATVYTGLYKFELPYDVNFITKDFYLQECVRKDRHHTPLSYNPEKEYYNPRSIEKKFISINGRQEGIRDLLCNFLLDFDCALSYNRNMVEFRITKNNKDVLKQFYTNNLSDRVCFDLNNIDADIDTQNIKKQVLDIDVNEIVSDELFFDSRLPDIHYNCFCSIVSESKFFYPYGHFADKTLGAIKMCRPFVVFSSPYTLEYAKSLGFKTFSDYWDESYDAETDHLTRFNKLLNVIRHINSFDLNQLKDMYQQMLPILQHNFAQLGKI